MIRLLIFVYGRSIDIYYSLHCVCVKPALADIERGFRVLKSEIEIAPEYHRLPQRIRAHAMLCFMALIVYRVMRQRLKLAEKRTHAGKGAATAAPHPAPQRHHQCRRPHQRHLHHQCPAVQRVHRSEPEKADPRRPIEPLVVAGFTAALYESNNLRRLVSNLGVQCWPSSTPV